jgi:hypothetical protein
MVFTVVDGLRTATIAKKSSSELFFFSRFWTRCKERVKRDTKEVSRSSERYICNSTQSEDKRRVPKAIS